MSDGQITAASTGNVAASAINISYTGFLHMDPSTISTSSNEGNGGPLAITGSGPLWIDHSNITTSVLGSKNGNGGDIKIQVPFIIMDTGAIQANTAAPRASGGTVNISVEALIPSFQSFGPSAPLGLNLVQAAAPDGISGKLNVTAPTLDIGSSLLALTGRPVVPVPLSRRPCDFGKGSSFSVVGRGGLSNSALDPLRIDWEDGSQDAANNQSHLSTKTSGSLFLYGRILPCDRFPGVAGAER